ncbi:hypothetical protein RB195_004444 [Necator americanus]|uniref:Collagen triple helix repeat protein n=1 Tax=Necator americanus TaxID=51031 RepID=A0ABR1BM30_NECAM
MVGPPGEGGRQGMHGAPGRPAPRGIVGSAGKDGAAGAIGATGLLGSPSYPSDDAEAIRRGGSRSGPGRGCTVLLADLVGQSSQLSVVDLGSNCRVVRQQFEMVDSMKSPPDAQHDLFLMDFTFHERIRHFIASALRTFVGVADVEDPFFISSDNGVQPVESVVSREQLSADVQATLAVAVAQCMWEPLTELFHHSERSQSIAHGGQRTAKTGSKIHHTFIWMLLRQILQFVERYCSRSTTARLIFEFLVSDFETLEPGAHRPLRREFSAEYMR